jgi:hypothetical protein
MYYPTAKQYSFNVAKYLKAGDNRIKIEARGEDSNITAKPLIYTITQTSLSLSAPNFNWNEIFKNDIRIPCIITGNINKLLYIKMIGEDFIYESNPISLGSVVYTEIAYDCVIPHPKKSGVFDIVLKVTNLDGTIETKPLNFSIICAEENAVGKYIAINNLVSTIKNWSNNNLFEYTCYDGNNSETDIVIHILKDNVIIKEFEYVVSVGSKQIFNYDLAIETLDNSNFQIQVQIKDADNLYKTLDFNVDNSLGYSAIAGATVYINPKTRSNTQSNRLQVINEITNTPINATWENVGWGIDGWTDDGNNHKSLHLIAGSKVVLDYKPFEQECAQTGKTIELYFKISNASAYKNPAISLFGDNKGIQITSDLVYLFSQSSSNIENNSVNFNDGDKIHMAITIGPDVYGISGFNLCVIYINGVKNREFVYTDQDYFAHTGKLTFGCLDSNLDIYGFRSYDFALTTEQIRQNRLNWETSDDVRNTIERRNDIFDAYGSNIDYHKVKNQWNVFVFEGEIPSLNNTGKFKGNLFIEWCNHKDWNSVVHDVTIDGQGTSSKKYYLWNLRWKLKNDTRVTYIKEDQTATTGSWIFHPDHPAIKVATAKLNWASSPQSHKMGSVNSINDLAKELNLLPTVKARVAIYMKSFVGFQKIYNEEGEAVYNFLGLYTLGPDKGDDATFDYDFDLYPKLLSLEGSDNAPLPALFRVPWNPNEPYIKYNADEEAFQYNETNSWDFNAGELNNIDTWIAAYNFVYECSNILQPFDGTLEELNEETTLQEYKNKSTELWLSDYKVVYYEAAKNQFIYSDTGNGIIDLQKQLVDTGYLLASDLENKTLDEQNTLFINARISKFKSEFENYFDLADAIFQRNWVEFNAATDNRAKNTYPYIFGLLEEGYRWKWRADDTDTIWPFTNQGQSKKSYEVEVGDKYSDGQPVWNGETSVFWNLLDLAFPQEVFDGMRAMIKAMEDLADNQTGTSLDRIYSFFHKYYFKEAQEYFSEELYNQTAKTLYETAKLAHMNGSYSNDTDPITQSLGDHYSAERRWILKRIPYMLSKYAYGEFSADSTDKIVVRASGNTITYDITPAIWLYPTIMNGTSVVKGKRTKPGDTCTIEVDLGGSSDQQNAILGPHYIKDIGAWYNKQVNGTMSIVGKMLTNLQIGSETEDIVISIDTLNIKQTPALEVLNISRIATLQGTLDLSEAPRLQECYAGGTSLNNIIFSNGGNLQKIVYGNKINYITFKNLPSLQTNNIDISACKDVITDFHIENCPQVNSIQLLYDIYSHQNSNGIQNLKRIRCTGIEETAVSEVVDMLFVISKGGYYGLNEEGILINQLPIFEGHVHVYSAIPFIVEHLKDKFPQLTITYDVPKTTPSFSINNTGKTSFLETDIIQLSAVSTNTTYSEIKWSIYNYINFTREEIAIDPNTGLVTLNLVETNTTFTKTFTARAISIYNTNVYRDIVITIKGIKIDSVTITYGGYYVLYGEDKNLTISYSPTNHTKTDTLEFITSDPELLSVSEDGHLNILDDSRFNSVMIEVNLKLDSSINNNLFLGVNDGVISSVETNAPFMEVANQYGWCQDTDRMLLSEAMSITTLPDRCFYRNNNIITAHEIQYFNISEISQYAFYSSSLQEITFPLKVTTLDMYAFSSSNLSTIIIPKQITKINLRVFNDNPITTLIFEATSTELSIDKEAFANILVSELDLTARPIRCLTNYSNNVYKQQFENLINLQSIHIPDSFTFSENPFSRNKLTSITCDENSTKYYVESGNPALFNKDKTRLLIGTDNFNFLSETYIIDNYSLCGCTLKDDFVFPENCHIYSGFTGVVGKTLNFKPVSFVAYNGMRSLTAEHIKIYNTITTPYAWTIAPFSHNSRLKSIEFNGEFDGKFSSWFGFNHCSSLENIIIPGWVTNLNSYCFINTTALKEIHIPDNISIIPDYCFQNSGIQIITGMNNVTAINTYAFDGCPITNFIVPDKVESLGKYCFRNTPITSITFNANIITLGYGICHNCKNLKQIDFSLTRSLKEISETAFFLGKDNNSEFIEELRIPDNVEVIQPQSFRSANIKKLIIPASITTINDQAFEYNYYLKEIYCYAETAPTLNNPYIFANCGTIGDTKGTIYLPQNGIGYDEEPWKTALSSVNKYYTISYTL